MARSSRWRYASTCNQFMSAMRTGLRDQGFATVESLRLVSHVVGELVQPLAEIPAHLRRHLVLVQRSVHAPQPLVAFPHADAKREVPHAEAWVAVAVRIHRRA